jgi:hypothetical protein
MWRRAWLHRFVVAVVLVMAPGCQPDATAPAPPLQCVAPEAGPADPCCTQCWGVLEEGCGPGQLPDFPDEAQTRREWRDSCELVSAAGECTSGVRFVTLVNVYISDTRYFDASGNFIGLERSSDFDAECSSARRYFPAAIDCERAMTEVICDHRPVSSE